MRRLLAVLTIAGLAVSACAPKDDDCTLADGKTTRVSLDYGQGVNLKPKLCDVGQAADVSYQWSLDGQAVSTSQAYRFLACPRFVGRATEIRVNLKAGARRAHHSWAVTVRDTPPVLKNCTATLTPKQAMAALQRGDYFGTAGGVDFKQAVSCLDDALVAYPCDIEVAFWAAYGDLLLFTRTLAASLAVSGVNERTLNALADERIDPLLERFDLLANEMPDDFTARSKDFDFSPFGVGDFTLHPGGEWDRGDMLALSGLFMLVKGGAKGVAAYDGSLKAVQIVVGQGLLRGRQGNLAALPTELQRQLIGQLDKDPNFLTLYPKDGEERLKLAQRMLIHGLRNFNQAITYVKAEKDDQRDDMLRYFDCGADAICPPEQSRDEARGDAGERIVKDEAPFGAYNPATDAFIDANGNGRYDPPWIKAGADAGEQDGKYSDGETIGTDVFSGQINRLGFTFTPLAQNFLADLAKNIEGPNPLDLAKYLELSQDDIINLSVYGGINIPSLRLSRWFEGPRDLRDFAPLWSHSKREFITDSEEEAFRDWGYDKLNDALEGATTATLRCPDRDLAARAGDPWADNFDPRTNANDGCDNDEDGLVDETTNGRSADYGTEGNGQFDFVDANANGTHDVGETSEDWTDDGLATYGQPNVGGGNGHWDAIDMAHNWPKGGDVGGREVAITKDPRNGTIQDAVSLNPMIDPLYYFFPDAQFNGVLMFEKPTVNADNLTLTDNAELMRFISKLVDSGRQLGR
jgi:hypothetical protein